MDVVTYSQLIYVSKIHPWCLACVDWSHRIASVECEWGLHSHLPPIAVFSWWRHQMETFSTFLALCAGNSPVTGEFPSQRASNGGFGVFFDVILNKFCYPMLPYLAGVTTALLLHRPSNMNVNGKYLQNTFAWYTVHDDVIKWKHFPRYWPLRGEFTPQKGQWRRALMFSLICAWINGWVSNSEAGDLRRHRAHYDVTVMVWTGRNQHTNFISPDLDQWSTDWAIDNHSS